MTGFIIGSEGNVKDIYLTEVELIDRYTQGNAWGAGINTLGYLATNNITSFSSPVQIVGTSSNWKTINARYHAAGIKSDGTLWLWGLNTNGQLGDNSRTHRSSPVQTVAGGTNWKSVSAGGYHTAAIKTDGTLWLWGNNQNGQLGTNDRTHRSSPIQTVAGGNDWKQVSIGNFHTLAIKTDGTLWGWGNNAQGRLGDNTQVHRSSPIQTVAGGTDWKQVNCGGSHTVAIKTDHTLWVWGNNGTAGRLGTNDTSHYSSPVQVFGGGLWRQVVAGIVNTAGIKTDGTLWLWGSNTNGQLGDNTVTSVSSPVQTVAGGTDWKFVGNDGYSSAAIKYDGTLWVWGANATGQLGTNDRTHRSSPVQTIATGNTWKVCTTGTTSSSTDGFILGVKYE